MRYLIFSIIIIFLLTDCQTIENAYKDFTAETTSSATSDCPDNSTPQCAISLPIGEKDSDAFARKMVYYKFEVDDPQKFTFAINPIPNTRGVTLEVQNAEYNRVHSSFFKAGHPNSVEVNMRTPGTYYAVLKPAACCSGANYNYGFSITAGSNTQTVSDNQMGSSDCPKTNTPQCAVPLSINEEDSNEFTRDKVYYSFETDGPQTLSFTLDPMPTTRGVSLEIQNSDYNRVHTGYFDKGSPGSTEFKFQESGKYYLILTPAACCSGASYDYTIAIAR